MRSWFRSCLLDIIKRILVHSRKLACKTEIEKGKNNSSKLLGDNGDKEVISSRQTGDVWHTIIAC